MEPFITLLDGTRLKAGDKVRARGEDGKLRRCFILEVLKGCGVDKAIVTDRIPALGLAIKHRDPQAFFGTVIRTRYQIKRLERGE